SSHSDNSAQTRLSASHEPVLGSGSKENLHHSLQTIPCTSVSFSTGPLDSAADVYTEASAQSNITSPLSHQLSDDAFQPFESSDSHVSFHSSTRQDGCALSSSSLTGIPAEKDHLHLVSCSNYNRVSQNSQDLSQKSCNSFTTEQSSYLSSQKTCIDSFPKSRSSLLVGKSTKALCNLEELQTFPPSRANSDFRTDLVFNRKNFATSLRFYSQAPTSSTMFSWRLRRPFTSVPSLFHLRLFSAKSFRRRTQHNQHWWKHSIRKADVGCQADMVTMPKEHVHSIGTFDCRSAPDHNLNCRLAAITSCSIPNFDHHTSCQESPPVAFISIVSFLFCSLYLYPAVVSDPHDQCIYKPEEHSQPNSSHNTLDILQTSSNSLSPQPIKPWCRSVALSARCGVILTQERLTRLERYQRSFECILKELVSLAFMSFASLSY
ncbi:unnamed protein product, partial [Protopolystoma xenopodis]